MHDINIHLLLSVSGTFTIRCNDIYFNRVWNPTFPIQGESWNKLFKKMRKQRKVSGLRCTFPIVTLWRNFKWCSDWNSKISISDKFIKCFSFIKLDGNVLIVIIEILHKKIKRNGLCRIWYNYKIVNKWCM